MSGFFVSTSRDIGQKAMEEYAHAIRAAEPIPRQERAQTTLPLAFRDLLRIHDKRRTEALEACATRWQSEKNSA